MNKQLIAILIIAALLRIVGLNAHIGALYGDEVSIAYNAWSILNTGRDEFGEFMPIQFESWGDQKNPVYIYLVSLFQIFTGLNEWGVRLPSALAGIAAVWLTYKFVIKLIELAGTYKDKKQAIGVLAATFLAINPWHIHISRGGYEANLALALGLASILLILYWLQNEKNKYLILSVITAALAMYTYYTTKMFLPMLLGFTFIWGCIIKTKALNIQKYIKSTVLYLLTFFLLCIPIIYLGLFAQGQARFATINIFANPTVVQRVNNARGVFEGPVFIEKLLINKPFIWARDFLEYYFDNLSPLFWYVTGDSSIRYHMGNHGMFYLIELPLVFAGMLFLFQRSKKIFLFLTIYLLLAPIPTALVGKYYGLRSIALLPIPMIFAAFGLFEIVEYIKTKRAVRLAKPTFYVVTLILALSFFNWLMRYIYIYPTYAYNWYDGMQKDAITYALNEGQKYDNVIVSRYYGKTEMYYAYYAKIDPREYQQNSQQKVQFANTEMVKFGKYYFGDIAPENIQSIPPNTLVIVSPVAPYGGEILRAREDKRPMFKVITTDSIL